MNPKFACVMRYILGIAFVVFGLNGFFHFLPMPQLTGMGKVLMRTFELTHYMLPFVKSCEVIAGVMLLAGFSVPFALVFLAPILANILMFNIYLDSSGLALSLFLVSLHVGLCYHYWANFKPLFGWNKCPSKA